MLTLRNQVLQQPGEGGGGGEGDMGERKEELGTGHQGPESPPQLLPQGVQTCLRPSAPSCALHCDLDHTCAFVLLCVCVGACLGGSGGKSVSTL